ncbi:MAG TPA: glycerol-3-phosphate 1-O-acyltransferase PlsY [Phycisphaerae bacterium]|nr:glycerol-3-phosphate 1-O-acyltransferase PlsY [Phycisphaerae bacterium]
MNPWLYALPLAAYLIGSTPFGVIIARSKGVDLRKCGSGNVGATNVGRTMGRKWGMLCFTLDALKGFIPTLLAGYMLGVLHRVPTTAEQLLWLGVAAGCIFGHVWSFWLMGKGGKGVATSLGVVLGFFPYFTYAGLCGFALWIIVTKISRYVSLGSVCSAVVFTPLFIIFNIHRDMAGLWLLGAFAILMSALIIYMHRGNIKRLIAGTENKIGTRKTGNP